MLGWAPEFDALLRSYLPALPSESSLAGDTRLSDFGLDSLSTVNLLLDIESGFDLNIPDELLIPETFETPNNLWKVVETLKNEAG